MGMSKHPMKTETCDGCRRRFPIAKTRGFGFDPTDERRPLAIFCEGCMDTARETVRALRIRSGAIHETIDATSTRLDRYARLGERG